jgi:hypothetical protein
VIHVAGFRLRVAGQGMWVAGYGTIKFEEYFTLLALIVVKDLLALCLNPLFLNCKKSADI